MDLKQLMTEAEQSKCVTDNGLLQISFFRVSQVLNPEILLRLCIESCLQRCLRWFSENWKRHIGLVSHEKTDLCKA